ncbi:hypothetical protein KHB02_017285 [Bacillus sp. FJAT-50051]|uniref:Desulfoferrodoxin n=1 Tax=Neobacillus citreus TaxID=2833578 RepID=A0A942T2Q6_9BACI|nr:hypothetical protein [Neobacillus citreus]MCH6267275.1 hypothetical protein [Neobacillus citreus]
MSVKIGTKYVCPNCHSEFIITKAGIADLKCCGNPLEKK